MRNKKRTLQDEIKKLQKQLKVIKDKEKELDALPEDKRLAEICHEKFCTSNHTDGCGWYYGSWEDEPLRYSRDTYLEQARRILAEVDYETALKVIDAL